MSVLCSSRHDQQIILRQLLSSIDIAQQTASNSWAVTLFGNGFRLNVGQVEVYTFLGDEVRLFLLGVVPAEAQQHGEVLSTDFRSVPQPQSCFYSSPSALNSVTSVLQPAHAAFVQAAAVTSKGNPRKSSPFARSHSPGLVAYAEGVTFGSHAFAMTAQPALDQFFEGAIRQVASNAYERNPAARSRCIEAYGPTCVVCGFNFQSAYGAAATGFIHVHHVTPLAAIGQSYEVNPITDLVPLCPNCHSVVHMANPPYSIEQVKKMFAQSQAQQGAPADRPTAASRRPGGG